MERSGCGGGGEGRISSFRDGRRFVEANSTQGGRRGGTRKR